MDGLSRDQIRSARMVLAMRRQGILDPHILSGFESVDRSAFVGSDFDRLIFEDCTIPIACGQSIPAPSVIAQLITALELHTDDIREILVVGAGSGYSCALLAQYCQHVHGVERYKTLAKQAAKRLGYLNIANVSIHHGDGLEGLGLAGPYDRIVLMGTISTIPAILVDQLSANGRLTALIQAADGTQTIRSIRERKIISEIALDGAMTPLVKGLAAVL